MTSDTEDISHSHSHSHSHSTPRQSPLHFLSHTLSKSSSNPLLLPISNSSHQDANTFLDPRTSYPTPQDLFDIQWIRNEIRAVKNSIQKDHGKFSIEQRAKLFHRLSQLMERKAIIASLWDMQQHENPQYNTKMNNKQEVTRDRNSASTLAGNALLDHHQHTSHTHKEFQTMKKELDEVAAILQKDTIAANFYKSKLVEALTFKRDQLRLLLQRRNSHFEQLYILDQDDKHIDQEKDVRKSKSGISNDDDKDKQGSCDIDNDADLRPHPALNLLADSIQLLYYDCNRLENLIRAQPDSNFDLHYPTNDHFHQTPSKAQIQLNVKEISQKLAHSQKEATALRKVLHITESNLHKAKDRSETLEKRLHVRSTELQAIQKQCNQLTRDRDAYKRQVDLLQKQVEKFQASPTPDIGPPFNSKQQDQVASEVPQKTTNEQQQDTLSCSAIATAQENLSSQDSKSHFQPERELDVLKLEKEQQDNEKENLLGLLHSAEEAYRQSEHRLQITRKQLDAKNREIQQIMQENRQMAQDSSPIQKHEDSQHVIANLMSQQQQSRSVDSLSAIEDPSSSFTDPQEFEQLIRQYQDIVEELEDQNVLLAELRQSERELLYEIQQRDQQIQHLEQSLQSMETKTAETLSHTHGHDHDRPREPRDYHHDHPYSPPQELLDSLKELEGLYVNTCQELSLRDQELNKLKMDTEAETAALIKKMAIVEQQLEDVKLDAEIKQDELRNQLEINIKQLEGERTILQEDLERITTQAIPKLQKSEQAFRTYHELALNALQDAGELIMPDMGLAAALARMNTLVQTLPQIKEEKKRSDEEGIELKKSLTDRDETIVKLQNENEDLLRELTNISSVLENRDEAILELCSERDELIAQVDHLRHMMAQQDETIRGLMFEKDEDVFSFFKERETQEHLLHEVSVERNALANEIQNLISALHERDNQIETVSQDMRQQIIALSSERDMLREELEKARLMLQDQNAFSNDEIQGLVNERDTNLIRASLLERDLEQVSKNLNEAGEYDTFYIEALELLNNALDAGSRGIAPKQLDIDYSHIPTVDPRSSRVKDNGTIYEMDNITNESNMEDVQEERENNSIPVES